MIERYDISPEEQERIEEYLTGQLSAPEEILFEKELLVNQELNAKTEAIRLEMIAIGEWALEQKLSGFHSKRSGAVRNIGPWKWAAAASVVIFLGLCLVFLLRDGKEKRLFKAYYIPDAGLPTAMNHESQQVDFELGMIDYKLQNYDAAIAKWQALSHNDTVRYFLGSAYLADERWEEAANMLKLVATQKNSLFYEDANWYYGLLLVKQGRFADARKFIERSAHEQKKALLNQLPEK